MLQDSDTIELATGFTVGDYKAARDRAKSGDVVEKNRIAEAIRLRFTERYITPAGHGGHPEGTGPVTDPSCKKKHGKKKNGFTMMAISCLMIEALESFRRGWANSNHKSEAAFCYFFNTNDSFKELRGHCEQFYKNVRCGILHQAETTGGWRITRKQKAPIFEAEPLLTINAERFLESVSTVLNGFCDELKTAAWDSREWKNVVKKMNALCDNCRRPGQ